MAGKDANLDKKHLVIPGHGNILISKEGTADPFDVKSFVIGDTATYPSEWESIGYTSKDNTVEFNKDGGDANSVDVWEEDAADISNDPILWSFVARAVSMQRKTFELAFGGGKYDETLGGYAMGDIEPVEKSVMILFSHGGKRGGVYIRRAKLSAGDAPKIDPEQFFEIEISGSILSPDVQTWGKVFWYDARNYEELVTPPTGG